MNKIKTIYVFFILTCLLFGTGMAKTINKSAIINAPVDSVWQAWTTGEGVISFFAPDCKIDLVVGGAYEMYFDLSQDQGKRGSEGCVIKYIKPNAELHFTWNAPPHLPTVRNKRTLVKITFTPVNENETEVKLVHEGWGAGEDWQKAFQYFDAVWGQVVLARLQYRFVNGPIDWDNPPPM